MKTIVEHKADLGGQGTVAEFKLGVEGANLKAEVSALYPIEKIVDQVMPAIDSLVDKIEQFIPGDQTTYATQLKADAKAEIVKLLSESI